MPAPEKPALSDEERARRLALLVERLNRPDGLDYETLARIEQLTDEQQLAAVDALELLGGDASFVVDTSAWWRTAGLPPELRVLRAQALQEDRVLTTPIVRMEVLYSARSRSEFLALELELDALRVLRNDRAVADAAMGSLRELAGRGDGYHRVPVTDALIAAAAAEHGGLAVLHRDAHLRSARRGPRLRERHPSRTLRRPAAVVEALVRAWTGPARDLGAAPQRCFLGVVHVLARSSDELRWSSARFWLESRQSLV